MEIIEYDEEGLCIFCFEESEVVLPEPPLRQGSGCSENEWEQEE